MKLRFNWVTCILPSNPKIGFVSLLLSLVDSFLPHQDISGKAILVNNPVLDALSLGFHVPMPSSCLIGLQVHNISKILGVFY